MILYPTLTAVQEKLHDAKQMHMSQLVGQLQIIGTIYEDPELLGTT